MVVVLSIAALTMVASFVGTITGFGLSTIMVPTLSLFFPFQQTVLLVGILHWFSSIWKVVLFHKGLRWELVLGFGLSGVVATVIGAHLAFHDGFEDLSRLLGIFLIAYVLVLFAKPSFQVRPTIWAQITGGSASGFFAGFFGIGGAIKNAFLSAFHLPKNVHLATTGAIALFVDTSRLFTYLKEGLYLPDAWWWGFVFFVPASFIGAKVAQYYVHSISQKRFRMGIAFFLLIVGVRLLFFPTM